MTTNNFTFSLSLASGKYQSTFCLSRFAYTIHINRITQYVRFCALCTHLQLFLESRMEDKTFVGQHKRKYRSETAVKTDVHQILCASQFSRSSSCMVSLPILETSLRQALLTLLAQCGWVTRPRSHSQDLEPSSPAPEPSLYQERHVSFPDLCKNEEVCIQSSPNEMLFFTTSRLSIQIVYSVTKIEKKILKSASLFYIKSFL